MSIIVWLIFIALFLVAIIILGVIFYLYQLDLAQKHREQSSLTIVDLQSRLKVSEQQLAEIRKNTNQTDMTGLLAKTIDAGIVILNAQGTILFINPYFSKLTGYYETECIGKPFESTISLRNEKDQVITDLIKHALSGHPGEFPKWTFILSVYNEKIAISGLMSTMVLPDGTNGAALLVEDKRMMYENEQEDKAFFSAAAHELRTPLSAINMALSLVLKEIDSMPVSRIKELLGDSARYITHLTALVNDFLNVSRIEQNRMTVIKTSFDIVALTAALVEKFTPLAREKHIYLHHDTSSFHRHVYADSEKTQEIITNLVSNAIKYTNQGGISITHKTEKAMLTTLVSDTGMGIDSQFHSLLFKKFQQISHQTPLPTTIQSTGLGLYIIKKLALLQNGDVKLVTSEAGKGSIFSVSLPLAPTT